MSKMYKYYVFNKSEHSLLNGIYIDRNENKVVNYYKFDDEDSITTAFHNKDDVIKHIEMEEVYLDLDPKSFFSSPEIFMEIFNEKLKKS